MLKETLQKPHVALIAVAIFLVCLAICGIAAAICAPIAFVYGFATAKRERALVAACGELWIKAKTVFQK